MSKHATVCFLSARNLGDAVIHSDFLKTLVSVGFADKYVVWTFPQAAFLFSDIPQCVVVTSGFPMGSSGADFFSSGYKTFIEALRFVRKMKVDATIELVSDFRERLVIKLLGASVNYSPAWTRGHPFRNHNRMSPFVGQGIYTVPLCKPNLYSAYEEVLFSICSVRRTSFSNSIARTHPQTRASSVAFRIGIHAFASLECKLWPFEYWQALLRQLSQTYPNAEFLIFGAPTDADIVALIGEALPDRSRVVIGSLSNFRSELATTNLLVGLDSFSVHLANSLQVPSVMLVGPNNPILFAPPTTKVVFNAGACKYQPCGGKPKCMGTDFQYICMKSITIADALKACETALPPCADASPVVTSKPFKQI